MPPFAGRCKTETLKRLVKAKQKANFMKRDIMFSLIGRAEREHLKALAAGASKGLSSLAAPALISIGISTHGGGETECSTPFDAHNVKERMDSREILTHPLSTSGSIGAV
jgi:hypothetical protein